MIKSEGKVLIFFYFEKIVGSGPRFRRPCAIKNNVQNVFLVYTATTTEVTQPPVQTTITTTTKKPTSVSTSSKSPTTPKLTTTTTTKKTSPTEPSSSLQLIKSKLRKNYTYYH